MKQIARHRHSSRKLLKGLHPDELVRLYDQIDFYLKNTTLRGQAKKQISSYFRKKFRLPITKKFVFQLPERINVKKSVISKILLHRLRSISMPHYIFNYIYQRMVIVFTKHRSLKDLVSNNIPFGKEYDPFEEYICYCKELHLKYGFPLNEKGCIQANSIDFHEEPLKSFFNRNCNDICTPSAESFYFQFDKAYHNFFNQLRRVFEKSNYHNRWTKNFPLHDTNMESLSSFTYLDYLFKQVFVGHQTTDVNSSMPKLDLYEDIRNELKVKLIMSELDKGKGILHFCCKSIWGSHTKKVYWDNGGHFLICNDTDKQSILQKFKTFFESEELFDIAKFNAKGDVPYLYIMAKEKDVNKIRPLASYFLHPLKLIYRYTSMALAVILKLLPEEEHFNLFKTFDTKDHLEKIFQTIENNLEDLDSTTITAYAGDIKNLFTELPHEEIEKAIFWTLQKVQSMKRCRGRHSVTINFKDKHSSRIGPSYDDNSTINISFRKIYAICKFDMNNAYFHIKNYILKQIFGIPQGSPLSPILAQCLLMYYESQFLNSIYDNTYFFGMRYFDDLRLISVAYRSSQIRRSEEMIEKFISGLPPSLILEPEFCDKGFSFLECTISIKPSGYMMIYMSKNYLHYQKYGKLKFFSLQNYYSYHGNRELIASNNLKTKFTAIINYCNSEQAIFSSVLSWFQDFLEANYPANVLISVLKHFYFCTKSLVWKALVEEVHREYSPRANIFKRLIIVDTNDENI